MRLRKSIIVVAACLYAVGFQLEVRADEKPQAPMQPATPKPGQEQTLRSIWLDIQTNQKTLAQMISSKNVSRAEDPAFLIRDLVGQMVKESTDLPAEKMTRLKQLSQDIQKLASDLDSTGDANNVVGTEANAKKLADALHSVAALYPAGTLPKQSVPAAGIAPRTY